MITWIYCLVFSEGPFQVQFYLSFFLSDLFYICNDLDDASYADDTIPYVCRQNYAEAIEFLEPTINRPLTWFKNNELIENSGKSNFLVSPYQKISLKMLGSTIESSPSEELLGITIDSELTFHKHYMLMKYEFTIDCDS